MAIKLILDDKGLLDHDELEGEDGHWYRKDLLPGTGSWLRWSGTNEIAGLQFTCPCGCGLVVYAGVKSSTHTDRPVWENQGSYEKPTLTPSLNIREEHWHGYLTNGVFYRTNELRPVN